MNTCYIGRSSRPAGLLSCGLLDGLQVRLRRPYLREAPAGFGLERLATAFMNNPGKAPRSKTVAEGIPEGFHPTASARVAPVGTGAVESWHTYLSGYSLTGNGLLMESGQNKGPGSLY
jgi:hypothetical protein